MDIPDAVVWGQVGAFIAAAAEGARRLWALGQRVDHLEADKVGNADHIREASECRANLLKCITDLQAQTVANVSSLREEVIGMAATVDMVAKAHDLTPHPRPSNGGGKRE